METPKLSKLLKTNEMPDSGAIRHLLRFQWFRHLTVSSFHFWSFRHGRPGIVGQGYEGPDASGRHGNSGRIVFERRGVEWCGRRAAQSWRDGARSGVFRQFRHGRHGASVAADRAAQGKAGQGRRGESRGALESRVDEWSGLLGFGRRGRSRRDMDRPGGERLRVAGRIFRHVKPESDVEVGGGASNDRRPTLKNTGRRLRGAFTLAPVAGTIRLALLVAFVVSLFGATTANAYSAPCRQAARLGGPCGCYSSEFFFGRSIRSLWAVRAWYRFPRSRPGPGTAAIWPGRHVAPVLSYDGRMVTIRDAWRVHQVRASRLVFVRPSGARL